MHFHFPFTTTAILWTLTFAAHLVLLVVLIGRERMARFPWFTTSIALIALRLLVLRLLAQRVPQITFAWIIITMLTVTAFVSLLVVVEVARRGFAGARRLWWLAGALIMMAIGAVVLRYWGTWPAWRTLASSPTLQLLEFLAQKLGLLADVETVGVGLMIIALGYRFGAGWRSHTQQIAIGLSTVSMAQIAVEAIWQAITRTAVVHGMNEYNRVVHLRDRIFNANNAVYIVVLVWWIVMLWRDEPGRPAANSAVVETAPQLEPPAVPTDGTEGAEERAGS